MPSFMRFPSSSVLNNPPEMQKTWKLRFDPSVREIPWGREWQPTLVILPGKVHGHGGLQSLVS